MVGTGDIQSVGGGFIVDGDELKTFVSGRSGAHPNGTLAKGDGTTYTGCKWGLSCWLQDQFKQDAAGGPQTAACAGMALPPSSSLLGRLRP